MDPNECLGYYSMYRTEKGKLRFFDYCVPVRGEEAVEGTMSNRCTYACSGFLLWMQQNHLRKVQAAK